MAPGDRQEGACGEDPEELGRWRPEAKIRATSGHVLAPRHPMTMDCNELEGQSAQDADGSAAMRKASQSSKPGFGRQDVDEQTDAAAEARAQRLSPAREQELGEERDLLDLLPMPGVTGGGELLFLVCPCGKVVTGLKRTCRTRSLCSTAMSCGR